MKFQSFIFIGDTIVNIIYNVMNLNVLAWKREAEESLRKAKSAEEEKAQAFKQRDEVGFL